MTRAEFYTIEVNQTILYRGREARVISVLDTGRLRMVWVESNIGITEICNESVLEFKSN